MSASDNIVFGVLLVNFHHSKGPEIEYSHGLPTNVDASNVWPYLPFQALPDGSHSFEETFTYFTLVFNEKTGEGPPPEGSAAITDEEADDYTTLFAISCSRQIKTEELANKEEDMTRSTVQKAIVVVARRPIFGQIKDKLSIITNAFFLQRDFTNKSIIDTLHANLAAMYRTGTIEDEAHMYVGLCLRRGMHDFGRGVLTILKAILLEKKILFYGSDVEALCNLQFGFISLIPNLTSNLQDCGSPKLHSYRHNLTMADSFKSSDRQSVLKFLGFPLQIFGEGGLFSPYSPLQQMDDLESPSTKFYVAGTSNSLLLERKAQICDILVNVDKHSIEILSGDKSLQNALQLTSHDKRWIDSINSIVSETWNENDYTTPRNLQFEGSEDFIRWQFEDYLIGMVSCEKLDSFVKNNEGNEMAMKTLTEEWPQQPPAQCYNLHWLQLWRETQNYNAFNNFTDDRIFDLFPPKHVCSSNDTLTSLQHKLNKSFQMLMRKERPPLHEKDVSPVQSQNTFQPADFPEDSSARPTAVEETTRGGSWKDYFNKRKNAKGHDPLSVPSTHNIISNSTPAAIGSALLSLGLTKLPSDDYENVSSVEKTSSDASKRSSKNMPDLENSELDGVELGEHSDLTENIEENPWGE